MKKEEFLNASGRRFRNQSGGGTAQQYYDAGVEMAYLAWEDGGVTSLGVLGWLQRGYLQRRIIKLGNHGR